MLRRLLATPAVTYFVAFALIAALVRSPLAQTQLAPPPVLAAFDVSAATLQTCVVPDPLATGTSAPFSVKLDLAGRTVQFDLVPIEVRASGYQLWLQSPNGLQPATAGPCTTYRGCATTNDMMFDANSNSELLATFTRIGQEISEDLYAPVAAAIRFAEAMRRKARGQVRG